MFKVTQGYLLCWFLPISVDVSVFVSCPVGQTKGLLGKLAVVCSNS